MSYNKELFKQMFNDGLDIMEKSNDVNLKRKRKNFEYSYKLVREKDDCNIQEFYSILHELRTYQLLNRLGLQPIANNDNHAGPDFISKIGYVECVTFSRPTDPKSNEILKGSFNRYKVYEPKVSQAIQEKTRKYLDYLSKGQIKNDIPRIICLNPGACKFDIQGTTFIEAVEKILYGIGCECVEINVNAKKEKWFRKYEDKTIKPNGAQIETDLCSNCEFSVISAILLIDNLVYEKYSHPIIFINHRSSIKVDRRSTRRILNFVKVGKMRFCFCKNGRPINYSKYNGI